MGEVRLNPHNERSGPVAAEAAIGFHLDVMPHHIPARSHYLLLNWDLILLNSTRVLVLPAPTSRFCLLRRQEDAIYVQ